MVFCLSPSAPALAWGVSAQQLCLCYFALIQIVQEERQDSDLIGRSSRGVVEGMREERDFAFACSFLPLTYRGIWQAVPSEVQRSTHPHYFDLTPNV